MRVWDDGEARPVPVHELGERYRRYRLADPAAEAAMARSLQAYGQAAPVTACWRDGRAELLDGFKRLAAATLVSWPSLSVRVLEVDERRAKAVMFGLNSVGRRPQELEEAWLVQALVREDGLSQLEAAELLGRHKSWVCRRLALLERLCVEAQAELRVGVLALSLARQLTRLPVGNQAALLMAARHAALTTVEVQGVIELLRGATPAEQALVLQEPRAALAQAACVPCPRHDPRLQAVGNRLARQLGLLLEQLGRLETWLRYPGLAELQPQERQLLAPRFTRLAQRARQTAATIDEVWLAATAGEVA